MKNWNPEWKEELVSKANRSWWTRKKLKLISTWKLLDSTMITWFWNFWTEKPNTLTEVNSLNIFSEPDSLSIKSTLQEIWPSIVSTLSKTDSTFSTDTPTTQEKHKAAMTPKSSFQLSRSHKQQARKMTRRQVKSNLILLKFLLRKRLTRFNNRS